MVMEETADNKILFVATYLTIMWTVMEASNGWVIGTIIGGRSGRRET